jgi:hypothetical protein
MEFAWAFGSGFRRGWQAIPPAANISCHDFDDLPG